MSITAIICEMNPLHLGHAYILQEIRKTSDCVIGILSGNFVQRAECALLDKYARAEAVICADADLVVELPFPWCSGGAEYFAAAGVALAHRLGADTLAFGVTADRGDLYDRIADVLLSPEFARELQQDRQQHPSRGAAQSRQACLQKHFLEDLSGLLESPNDILAIEYVKSIRQGGYPLRIQPIKRLSSEEDPRFLGATSIRERLADGESVSDHLPEYSGQILEREMSAGRITDAARLRDILFFHLRRRCEGPAFAEGGGGVLERLVRCAETTADGQEMFRSAATKKYTNARLRRAALFDIMAVEEDVLRELPAYTLLLGATETGCAYLSRNKKKFSIPVLTKPSDERKLDGIATAQYARAKEADRLYTLCQRSVAPADAYLRRTPYIE